MIGGSVVADLFEPGEAITSEEQGRIPGGGSMVSRRSLLGLVGVAAATGGLSAASAAESALGLPLIGVQTLTLRRRDDFVNLAFDLHNITVSADGRRLLRTLPLFRSTVVVLFPPQSLTEARSSDTDPLPARPVQALLSARSRLAYDVTDDLPFDLTVQQLLNWVGWDPLLVPNALGRTPQGRLFCYPAELRAPTATETSLELPWRLQLSPHAGSGWAHSTSPVTGPTGWTELWHTRLGVRDAQAPNGVDEHDDENRIVRAVWARYPQFASWVAANQAPQGNPPDGGVPLPMDARDRHEIVRLSSDSTIDGFGGCSQPLIGPRQYPNRREPVEVNLLMLTSMGGWLDSTSYWRRVDSPGSGGFSSSLESWQHRATMGRDHFVRLVRRGFLFPFGHRAVYIELTERKMLGAGTQRAAYLRRKNFIIVRQLEKSYTDDHIPHSGHGMPFSRIRVLTRITPNLHESDEPISRLGSIDPQDAFVPTVDGPGDPLFQFLFRGTDHAGRTVDFRAPVVLVFDRPGENATQAVIDAYTDAGAQAGLRIGEFGKKHTAVAVPADPAKPGDTTVVVDHVIFTGEPATSPPPVGQSLFYPKVEEFSLDLPEVRALAGDSAKLGRFRYPNVFLANGAAGAANPGQVFLEVEAGKETALGFDTDRAGGVATPNIQIRGLTSTRGPVSEAGEAAAKQEFDPTTMFANAATLLGGINLGDVLAPLTAGTANPQQAIELVTRDLGGGKLETRLGWRPDLTSFAVFDADGASLELRARVVAEPSKPPYFEINGRLRNFALTFFPGAGFILVKVAALRFTAASDQKPDVDCDISDVKFTEALSFVRELASICNFGGGTGLSIVPGTDRITIGLDVPLPSLTVGILGLENIKVSAGLVIPFNSTPVLMRFAFCSREDPFTLSVMFFRGSGFVAIEAGAHGMDMVEFSFEFGVGMSIDLGVASGCVEIMGGVYFQLANNGGGDDDQTITFSAYLRLRGELDVLGIISASLEFYLGLTYKSADRMYGEAILTVSIDLFIFSGEVEVSCRRELKRGGGSTAALGTGKSERRKAAAQVGAGDGGEPIRFGDAFPENVWTTYCGAFAAF